MFMQEEFIIGINGWQVRGHDASAALIKCKTDGLVEIVAAAEEERFLGVKHAYDTLPLHAVQFCLDAAGIQPEDLSSIAVPFEYPKIYETRGLRFDVSNSKLRKILFPNLTQANKPEIFYVNHHLAHAVSAFAPSMSNSSLVMVIDGQGEFESSTIWSVGNRGKQIQKIASSDIASSLGYFYEALTEFIGFQPNEPGKTMGLAPYGNPERYKGKINDLFVVNGGVITVQGPELKFGLAVGDYLPIDEQHQVRLFWLKKFSEITGMNPNDNSRKYSFRNFPKGYADLAASGQRVLEEVVVTLAAQAQNLTQSKNAGIAGGVGLNCVANGLIAESGLFDRIYVQPASNDAGTSLGAALEVARQKGYGIHNVPMAPYLGLSVSNQDILKILTRSNYNFIICDDAYRFIADLVANGKVVGLFQGRAEFGPRALGNRSFIADARQASMQDYINQHVKGREEGRPLAPAVLDSDSEYLFGQTVNAPHMTVAYQIQEGLDAVTHVDGTTRPQIVTAASNSSFYRQLQAVQNKIGIGAVINTSLNLNGPIVNTPQQALRLLETTGAEAIVFNNRYLVRRK